MQPPLTRTVTITRSAGQKIGLSLVVNDGVIRVAQVHSGYAAATSGVRKDDIIVAVAGTQIVGGTTVNAVYTLITSNMSNDSIELTLTTIPKTRARVPGRRLLNTNALDGLRAIAVFHIVLGHHAIYTGFFSPRAAAPADTEGPCSASRCSSLGGNCWAGSPSEPCTCSRGAARLTGSNTTVGRVTYYEYTCCTDGINVGEACGDYQMPVYTSDDPLYRTTRGFDLIGGASMGLFYIISGFVLWLGYGKYGSPKIKGACSGCSQSGCMICCCGTGVGTEGSRVVFESGCCMGCLCEPLDDDIRADALSKPFDVRSFYWKRFARLGPLWYLGNAMALPIYFFGYSQTPWEWGFWTGLVISIPPIGLNAWTLPIFFPPAGHLWTISTMAFFYLMFPVLHHRVKCIKPREIRCFALTLYCIQLLVFVFVALGMPIMGYWIARGHPLSRLPVFIMGMLAARQAEISAEDTSLRQSVECGRPLLGPLHASVLIIVWLLVITLGILEQIFLAPLAPEAAGFWVRILSEAMLPILYYDLTIAMVYPMGTDGQPSRAPTCFHALLASGPMRWLAEISLAVYVVHETLIRELTLAVYGPLEPGMVQEVR